MELLHFVNFHQVKSEKLCQQKKRFNWVLDLLIQQLFLKKDAETINKTDIYFVELYGRQSRGWNEIISFREVAKITEFLFLLRKSRLTS